MLGPSINTGPVSIPRHLLTNVPCPKRYCGGREEGKQGDSGEDESEGWREARHLDTVDRVVQ